VTAGGGKVRQVAVNGSSRGESTGTRRTQAVVSRVAGVVTNKGTTQSSQQAGLVQQVVPGR